MIYTDAELKEKIYEMLKDFETEVVEFKEANNGYSFKDIGKYFSVRLPSLDRTGTLETCRFF